MLCAQTDDVATIDRRVAVAASRAEEVPRGRTDVYCRRCACTLVLSPLVSVDRECDCCLRLRQRLQSMGSKANRRLLDVVREREAAESQKRKEKRSVQ